MNPRRELENYKSKSKKKNAMSFTQGLLTTADILAYFLSFFSGYFLLFYFKTLKPRKVQPD